MKAQLYAANVTVDFREGGAIGMWINQVVPFFNASIQGPARMADAFRRRPATTMTTGLIWLTLPALAAWYRYKDEDWFKRLPPFERYRYWHIRVGDIDPKNQRPDAVIRIPRPFEWGHLFASIPEGVVEQLYGQNPTAVGEAIERSLRDMAPFDLNPSLGIGALAPAAEVYANWSDFRDRPLISEGLRRLKPEERYGTRTTETAKAIGRLFGVPPIYVDHLVEGYTGGLGGDILRGAEQALRQTGVATPKGMAPSELADIPVIGRIFLRPTTSRIFDDFYAAKERVDQEFATAKFRKWPMPEGIVGQHRRMDAAADRLSKRRKQVREVIEDTQRSEDQKRHTLVAIERQMEQIAKNAMPQEGAVFKTTPGGSRSIRDILQRGRTNPQQPQGASP